MDVEAQRLIIGGGLAGLSLAAALLERGADPSALAIFDGGDDRRGSSAPAAMLHPFPGRRLRVKRGQGSAFVKSWECLQRWRRTLDGDKSWRTGPMIRPITDDQRGRDLVESWRQNREDFPELVTCRRVEADEIENRYAGVQSSTPVLIYEPAAGVVLSALTTRLRDSLQARGISFFDDTVVDFAKADHGWRGRTEGGIAWRADEVVLAVGAALDGHFPGLDLRRRAGELVLLEVPGLLLPAFVNAKKHVFQRPDGLLGLGSTYFDPESWDARSDDEAIRALKAGITDVIPSIADARVVDLWRGVRGVFGSDHMPLVGPIPGHRSLFSMGAFGSKGLLWAPAAGHALAALLVDGEDVISPHMDTRRMSADKWSRPNPAFSQ